VFISNDQIKQLAYQLKHQSFLYSTNTQNPLLAILKYSSWDWSCGSSDRVPALQSPEFKNPVPPKKKKERNIQAGCWD
jgi:hypothetical protein